MTDYKDIFKNAEKSPVLVNQKELIIKILARYSAEFTVFRELIQNAIRLTHGSSQKLGW